MCKRHTRTLDCMLVYQQHLMTNYKHQSNGQFLKQFTILTSSLLKSRLLLPSALRLLAPKTGKDEMPVKVGTKPKTYTSNDATVLFEPDCTLLRVIASRPLRLGFESHRYCMQVLPF